MRKKQRKHQPIKHVLAPVQTDQRLARILSIAVHGKRDRRRATETTSETDDAEEDRRHDPGVPLFCGPAETPEPGGRGERNRQGHDEAEFGLVDAVVVARHVADDDVGELACDCRAQDAADEGGEVDEACLDCGEAVGVGRRAVDCAYGFGEDDQPADGERVDGRGPEDCWVREEDEGPQRDADPGVGREAARVGR